MAEKEQLAALASLDELLAREEIEYWVFGGWAVDLHAGEITRPHDDLDIAVSASEHGRVRRVLAAAGWTPVEEGPGYVAYARDGIRIEVTSTGEGEWPDGAFGEDLKELEGVCARVISLRALKVDKSQDRGDATVAGKDHADVAILSRLRP